MKITLYSIGFIVLGIALWAGIIGINPVLLTGSLAFMFIMFINNLDRISEIKASGKGFEARTREVIKEAKVTIKEMQNLVKIIVKIELSLVMRTGRFGSFSDEDKEKIKNDLLDILKQLQISMTEQQELLTEWHNFEKLDYVHYILGGSQVPSGISNEYRSKWKVLRRRGFHDLPTPDELTNFLINGDCLTTKRKELIEDYKYYISNLHHRRPEIWHQREEWGVLNKQDTT